MKEKNKIKRKKDLAWVDDRSTPWQERSIQFYAPTQLARMFQERPSGCARFGDQTNGFGIGGFQSGRHTATFAEFESAEVWVSQPRNVNVIDLEHQPGLPGFKNCHPTPISFPPK